LSTTRFTRFREHSRLSIKEVVAGHVWLTPIILATQEAEIRKIIIQSQPGQIICETLSQKILPQKKLLNKQMINNFRHQTS
jgi:hypothetical protein